VVVTGTSSGNGKAVALLLAEKGARLVLATRRTELLEATIREAEARGAPEVLAVPCDTTERKQVEAVAEATLARWGRIDAWIKGHRPFSFVGEVPPVFRVPSVTISSCTRRNYQQFAVSLAPVAPLVRHKDASQISWNEDRDAC
jgi:NAD(P)-dependent dehydrogenase (short-subunit alcohol dehydrogenase family)